MLILFGLIKPILIKFKKYKKLFHVVKKQTF